MLWSEVKEQCRQLRGAGGKSTPRISEILSLWFEEAGKLSEVLREKDLDRSQPVQALAALDYDSKTDRPALNTIRGLASPVTVSAVLTALISGHSTHPVVSALEGCFGCKGPLLISTLKLAADAPVVSTENTNSALTSLTTDLSARAEKGEFVNMLPSYAVDALERSLLKARRGSVILTGEPGAGKTTVTKCLAHRIATGKAHPRLKDVRILELNVGSLVAGTQFRGQFSQRVDELLKALVEEKGKIVLWIDEVHTVIGAGRVHNDSYDFSNALKTVLEDGSIRVIGATTDTEYDRYILKAPAFARRFERMRLVSPSGEALHAIIRKQVIPMSMKHSVVITDPAWREALRLSDLYLVNRAAQPDRVLDLIDSACTLVTPRGELENSHLVSALSQMTGVPRDILENGVVSRLPVAAEAVSDEVFGQDEMVEQFFARLRSNPFRRGAETRPLGSFLLLGASGVGKTLFAKTVAGSLFGPEMYLCVHGGEFSEGGIAKLIGTPLPGMELQSDGGMLPEFLRKHPCGVILFDELEKAHRTLWVLLLGLLDQGELRSGNGRAHSARNCIIICTSNVLTTRDLTNSSFGFGIADKREPDRRMLTGKLSLFHKELLNRFDDLLVANSLSVAGQLQILKRHLQAAIDAGIAPYSDKELAALLQQHAPAVETEGGRAIERLAADMIVSRISQQQRLHDKPTATDYFLIQQGVE